MRWSLACLTLAVACTPPEKVPSTDGLSGYWRPADGEQTVFAFAPATDAEELFNLSGNMLAAQSKPVSAVYVNDALVQLATYEATATELKQTVLVDMANPPGTAFSTRIYEFERGVKLVLESKSTGGPRQWDGSPFCPRSGEFGWGAIATSPCPNALATGGSMAFDKQGRLFAFTGAAPGVSPSATCPPTPALLVTNRGCGTAQLEAPNSRLSSTRVFDDDVLRIAYVPFDSSLRVRERAAGETAFTETTLTTLTNLEDLLLVDHGGPLVLTGGRLASGAVRAWRKDATGWSEATLKPKANGQPITGLVAATVDRSTRLWVATSTELLREGDASFEPVPAPGAITSLYVDPENTLHAAFNTPRGLEYGVLRGAEWERHVMDSSAEGVIVTHGTKPYRVMTTVPFPDPWLTPTLLTLHEDGRLESEVTGGLKNFQPTVNATFFAVGPSGEIAASLTGESVMTRSPRGRLYPKAKKLELVVEGPPVKVTSLDGRISCDGSCTVDVTLGDRIAFAVEKKPGVLATLPSCDRPGRIPSAPCFITVVPGQAGTRETNPVFKVVTRATPLQSAVVASNNQGLSTTFGVNGDWVAVGILFSANATTFQLDDVTIPVTGSFESVGLALVNRSTKSSLFLALPSSVTVDRVQPDGRGGLWAIVSTSNQAVQVAGATLGASGSNVLSFIHLTAAGAIDTNVVLGSFPRAMPAAYLRPAIGANGSAAVVFSRGTALSQLGITESNALVRVDAAGTRSVHGFAAPTLSGGPLAMVDEGRIAFATNVGADTTVFLWANGQLSRLAIAGATAQALHVSSSGAVAVALSTATSPLTVSGRMATGLRHVVLLDGALAVTATFSLPEATTAAFSWGVGQTSRGVAFLSDGQLHWLANSTLERLRPALPLPTTTMRISGVPGPGMTVADDSVWLLARPDGDFGVTGATALGQLGVF